MVLITREKKQSLKTWKLCALISFLAFGAQGQTRFVENLGQWPEGVQCRAEIADGLVYLQNDGITYQFWDKELLAAKHNGTSNDTVLNCHNVKLYFEKANPHPLVVKEEAFETFYNFYKGNDPSKWAAGALAYQKITYYSLYDRIDLVVESTLFGFKYSFIVHPGGNPDDIKLRFEGASDITLDEVGGLRVTTTLSTIAEEKPVSFQNGFETEIKTEFDLDINTVGFILEEYDPSQTLTIDPSVIFSALSLSVSDNWGFTATYDEDGNGYSGGTVYDGGGYIATIGSYQRVFKGGPLLDDQARDCGIFKLSADGKRLIYATYYGGSGNEQPHSLVVNSNDELIAFGTTTSNNLPTVNSAQRSYGGKHDIFLAKFNRTGSKLLASTYLGDDEEDGLNGEYRNYTNRQFRNINRLVYNYGDIYRGEVLVDSMDNVYIASTSSSNRFPTTTGAYSESFRGGAQDAIVVKLSPDLDSLKWSTFLGGNNIDAAYSLDFDKDGNVYVTGGTKSSNFPRAGSPYDNSHNGGMCDAYVTLISADGSKLLASTFIGTDEYDQGFFIKVGPDNSPYVLGQTESSNFPKKGVTNSDNQGLFVTKFKKDLSDIKVSRKFGAGTIVNISPAAFSVDQCGRVYFSGWGGLTDGDNTTGNTSGLRTTVDAEKRSTDGRDFYIAVYTADLETPIYATFWGGSETSSAQSSEHVDGGTSRFDKRGVIYQAICAACGTGSVRFPTSPSSGYGQRNSHAGTTNCNNALVKIDLEGPALFTEFERSPVTCKVPQTIDFTNYTEDATSFIWNMGDGKSYTDSNVRHTFTQPGDYIVSLIAYNPLACNLRDTQKMKVSIYAKSEADFVADIDICTGEVEFNRTGQYGKKFNWDLGDATTSTDENPSHQYKEGKYTITLLTDDNTDCADTFSLDIEIIEPYLEFDFVLDTCVKTITTTNKSKGFEELIWDFGDGDTAKSYEPEHIYFGRGEYELKYTMNPGLDCEDVITRTIDIPDPESNFTFRIDTCSFSLITTNNSIDADGYKWKVSDGQKSKESEPVIRFAEGDRNYTVQLVAAPFSACADTADVTFRMPDLPNAEFIFKADTCVSAIQFFNKSTDAPGFLWDFGNGETSRSKHPFINFRDTGTFLITLTAYPNSDCPDALSKLVDVDTFRFALFDIDLDTCDFAIQINNKSRDLDSFQWRLGDGTPANGEEPSHKYDDNGEYIIELYGLKTLNGCRDTFFYTVQIPELPVAKYTKTTDSCLNTYIFSDTSDYAVKAIWKSSTGDSATGPKFRVEFPRKGDYEVMLIARSEHSCSDTLIIPVTIDSIPTAAFEFDIDSCSASLGLRNNSFGEFRSWWDLDDNIFSRDFEPIAQYDSEDYILYKTVTLVINKGTECEDTLVQDVEFTQYLVDRINFSNVFTPKDDGYNDLWKVRNLRKDCDEYQLFIFNRWGNMVTQVQGDADFEWDGTTLEDLIMSSNTPVAPGVYYYVFKSNRVQLNGSITLIR